METVGHQLKKLALGDVEDLMAQILQDGYDLIGPVRRNEAIVYDRVKTTKDLPKGWTDVQEAGTYRLKKRNDQALFGYNVGPDSWKKYLHEPKVKLFTSHRDEGITAEEAPPAKLAFLGVRACELNAIQIQDQVFLKGPYVDRHYKNRRDQLLIIAVQCVEAGATCFCTSMQAGPSVSSGFDLALTEVITESDHYFIAKAGSERGRSLIEALGGTPATEAERALAEGRVEQAAQSMGRQMSTDGLKSFLYENIDNPHWADVASRCMSCANCTMVCPTCFCTTVEDVADVTGEKAERWRTWDSCFTVDFTHFPGGSIRARTRSRYRQWMTHKLASWEDQFGTSGCVGCGRCIAWCPVGIDITAEVRAMRNKPMKNTENPEKEAV